MISHCRSLPRLPVCLWLSRAARLVFRSQKSGVLEAQRREDLISEETVQAFARNDFDYPAEDVRGHAVVPHPPWLVRQRYGRKFSRHLLIAVAQVEDAGLVICGFDQRGAEQSVGKTRRVSQQVVHAHGVLLAYQTQAWTPCRAALLDPNLRFAELRKPVSYRFWEKQTAAFREDHGGDRGNRFGHGRDAKDVVALQADVRFTISESERSPPSNDSFAGEKDDGSGDLASFDILCEEITDALQPLGIKSCSFGIFLVVLHGSHASLSLGHWNPAAAAGRWLSQ